MRNRVVPHFGHLPFIAGFPFFSFTFFGSAISRFARHFTQYAWTMGGSPSVAHRPGEDKYMGVTIFRRNNNPLPSPQPGDNSGLFLLVRFILCILDAPARQ